MGAPNSILGMKTLDAPIYQLSRSSIIPSVTTGTQQVQLTGMMMNREKTDGKHVLTPAITYLAKELNKEWTKIMETITNTMQDYKL